MKKLYYISWNGTCARFTRCFEDEIECEKFKKNLSSKANIQTWEHEIP